MTIDPDIIGDLLPLYRSGLASAATRRLIEQWLIEHGGAADEGAADDGADAELAALLRVRRLLAWQRWLFGIAVGLSVLLLSSEARFAGGRLVEAHLLAMRHPLLFAPAAAGALACWAAYFRLKAKLR